MNILILTTSYPSNESDARGSFVHSLAKALLRRGHNLRVVVPGRSGSFGWRRIDGIEVRHFRYAFTRAGHSLTDTGGGIPEALRRSRWNILRLPALMICFFVAALRQAFWADVIWANWLGAGMVGGAAGRLCRKPMVLTLRGDDAYLIHDKNLWRRCGAWVFRRSVCITAVSKNMASLLEPYAKVVVPTFGVDSAEFHPNPTLSLQGRGVQNPQGLFVGNISLAKGIDTLLKALAKCDCPWRFVFAGDGPDMEKMKQLANELNISNRIEWLGNVDFRKIPELMRQSDFLVLPSRSEGRPNVVMEAMASGLPVIATSVGSIPDMVQDGQTGILVPVDDENALSTAIARLCNDTQRRLRMGQSARAYIESANLTWDRTAQEFDEIFSRAISRS